MATVILIVFLSVVAILGGWWLKTEKERQKKDLIRRGKIASGNFDEVPVPNKKKPKRKRKKREGNWLDPKYVPPEIPDKQMLDAWLERASKLVDELMPMVHAYRKKVAEAAPVYTELKAAQAARIMAYQWDLTTHKEAQSWYTTLEERFKEHQSAKTTADQTTRALRKQFTPVFERVLSFGSLIHQADSWELYKAPEPFHEKLEILKVLYTSLNSEFGKDKEPSLSDSDQQPSWRRRSSWKSWDAEPEPEPVEDTTIVATTRQCLLDALAQVAALAASVHDAHEAQKACQEAANHVKLVRPTKPTEEEVETLISTALAWARGREDSRRNGFISASTLRRNQSSTRETLAALHKAVNELREAIIPEGDKPVKEAIEAALTQVEAYVKACADHLGVVLSLPGEAAATPDELAAERTATTKGRALLRKAGFAIAQHEVAKASVYNAEHETVPQGEVVPPTLTQSSAAAFVNAHSRMTDIDARNKQKKEAQAARVKQLKQQLGEREQQAKQAMDVVRGMAVTSDIKTADMAVMRSAAELFAASF
jgi:hypothetical protein